MLCKLFVSSLRAKAEWNVQRVHCFVGLFSLINEFIMWHDTAFITAWRSTVRWENVLLLWCLRLNELRVLSVAKGNWSGRLNWRDRLLDWTHAERHKNSEPQWAIATKSPQCLFTWSFIAVMTTRQRSNIDYSTNPNQWFMIIHSIRSIPIQLQLSKEDSSLTHRIVLNLNGKNVNNVCRILGI